MRSSIAFKRSGRCNVMYAFRSRLSYVSVANVSSVMAHSMHQADPGGTRGTTRPHQGDEASSGDHEGDREISEDVGEPEPGAPRGRPVVGERDLRVAPGITDWPAVAFGDAGRQSRSDRDRPFVAEPACEGQHGLRGLEREVLAVCKQLVVRAAQTETRGSDMELDRARAPVVELRCGLQELRPPSEVDGPAVVGVDEREVPELAAPIYVRRARHCQLPGQHGERVDRAEERDVVDEVTERIEQQATTVGD